MQKNKTKYFSFFAILCFFMLFLNSFNFVYAEDNLFKDKIDYSCSAKSAVMIEASTKRIVYSKNAYEALPMASTTKIVTAITAIENCDDLDKIITIDKSCVGVSGTSIYLKEGEQISIRELLYGLMLRSGNDASVALAKEIGGSVENFCAMMNNLAKKVGAQDSNFKNPHGLDENGHHTTAYDLALITAYALENKDFAEIVKTKSIKICEGKENFRYLVNKNKLLNSLEGCIGVKTGFTDDAGRCLVSACERDNLRFVCVVFNCGPMFEESSDMLKLAFQKFRMIEILPSYFYVKNVEVKNGKLDNVGLYSKQGLSLPLSIEEESNLSVEFNVPENLKAPLKKDDEVGEIQIYFNNHLIFSEKVYTIEEVDSKLYKDKIKEILDNWNA
ncbi:MAG: D-alanyl-D-alanine carboxypeptidase [Clostridia bacterium]|nr:D-alanyl-D-alanine carboxypeptidase [Clostridia bacterium]